MDIVVTIPRSEYKNDDQESKDFDNSNGDLEQFWTLSMVPTKLQTGDRVYFVKHNRIDSSMRVKRIEKNHTTKCETTKRDWSGACQIFMDDPRDENVDVKIRGFMGFRYRWW